MVNRKGPYRARDNRRQRLYDAEHSITDIDRTPMTLDQCQTYVDRLWAEAWTRRNFRIGSSSAPRVKANTHTSGHYNPTSHTIALGVWARQELVLLHEVAHALQYRCADQEHADVFGYIRCGEHEAHHGWHFAQTFLALVRHKMGQAAHDTLKASFKAHGVRITRPRTSVTTR